MYSYICKILDFIKSVISREITGTAEMKLYQFTMVQWLSMGAGGDKH